MPWRPVGHGVEALYLATPLGRRVGYGVYVYRYRGLLVDTGPPKARPFAPKPLRLYRRLVWGSPRPAQVEAAERVGPLHLLPTPGHAPDHVALYDPEAGLFFGGDLFLGVRASLATPGFDLQALLQSLRRALALKPRAFYCAHAGPLQAPLEALQAKLDFLEGKREEALRLKARGLTPKEALRRLFGGESPLALLSGGEMSRLAFVEALMMEP